MVTIRRRRLQKVISFRSGVPRRDIKICKIVIRRNIRNVMISAIGKKAFDFGVLIAAFDLNNNLVLSEKTRHAAQRRQGVALNVDFDKGAPAGVIKPRIKRRRLDLDRMREPAPFVGGHGALQCRDTR